MTIRFVTNNLRRLENAGPLQIIVFKFEEVAPFRGLGSLVDWRLGGHLSNLVINGFLTGKDSETLLMPLQEQLPGDHLLVFGLGTRDDWNQERFEEAVKRAFTTTQKLACEGAIIALPGRPEEQVESTDAIDWFLPIYEEMGKAQEIAIVEPLASQSAMIPAVERWRLRQSMPNV